MQANRVVSLYSYGNASILQVLEFLTYRNSMDARAMHAFPNLKVFYVTSTFDLSDLCAIFDAVTIA